jgi:hypothetical protein
MTKWLAGGTLGEPNGPSIPALFLPCKRSLQLGRCNRLPSWLKQTVAKSHAIMYLIS